MLCERCRAGRRLLVPREAGSNRSAALAFPITDEPVCMASAACRSRERNATGKEHDVTLPQSERIAAVRFALYFTQVPCMIAMGVMIVLHL